MNIRKGLNYITNKCPIVGPLLGETLTKDVNDLNKEDLKKIGTTVLLPVILSCSEEKSVSENPILQPTKPKIIDYNEIVKVAEEKTSSEKNIFKHNAAGQLIEEICYRHFDSNNNPNQLIIFRNTYDNTGKRIKSTDTHDDNNDGKIDRFYSRDFAFNNEGKLEKELFKADDNADGKFDRTILDKHSYDIHSHKIIMEFDDNNDGKIDYKCTISELFDFRSKLITELKEKDYRNDGTINKRVLKTNQYNSKGTKIGTTYKMDRFGRNNWESMKSGFEALSIR